MNEPNEKKAEIEVTDKEENVSLKDNIEIKKDKSKENARKKKGKKIALENIDLGTKPINISLSKYDFLNYYNLSPSMKNRIKMIAILSVVIVVLFILLILKGKFHQSNIEISENNNNNFMVNLNSPVKSNSNKPSSSFASSGKYKNITLPSASSSKKNGL